MCIITASIVFVVLLNFFEFIPSVSSLFKCTCGIKLSITSKNATPNINPIVVGNQVILLCCSAISKDGIIKDHIDAAIITPDAKPNNNFSTLGLILFFIKITIAEPKVVPINGINNPIINPINSLFFLTFFIIYIYCFI